MTDLLTGVLSNLSFILEDFINIKYLPAIFSNISTSLIVYLCLSILIIFLTRSKWPIAGDENDSTPKPSGFDISPTDEVTFESSVSKEEIDEAISKNTPGSYIPLLGNASEEQIESFLRGAEDESGRDSGTLAARVKKARQAAIVKKIEADMTEDEKLNEQDVQRKQLEKIFSLLNQHESDVGKMSENDLQNQLKMYKQ